MPEQFLFDNRPVQNRLLVEQTAFRAHADVFREFNDIGGWDPRVDVRLERWRLARANVMARSLRREINEATREKQRGGTISALKAGITNIEEYRANRVRELNERRQALEGDAERIGQENSKFGQYKTKVDKFRELQEKTRAIAAESLGAILDNLGNPAGGTYGGNAHGALAALSRVLTDAAPGADILIDGQLIQSTRRRREQAQTDRQAIPRARDVAGGEAPQMYDRYLVAFAQSKEDTYRITLQEIQNDINLVNETLKKLREANSPARVEMPNDLSEADQAVLESKKIMTRFQQDYAEVTRWNMRGGVSLTEADLITQPIDEIMGRINTAHSAGAFGAPPVIPGWPAEQNNIAENRNRVIHAMTEARARAISASIGMPGAEFIRLTNVPVAGAVGGWGLTEHQLNTLTTSQIHDLITARHTANPGRYPNPAGHPAFTDEEIETAREVAGERLAARSDAIEQVEQHLRIQEATADRLAQAVDVSLFKRRLETAVGRMQKQEEIFSAADLIAASPGRFFNRVLVDPANTRNYTEAERATYMPPGGGAPRHYSVGYLEFMKVLFDYENAKEGLQNSSFQLVSEMLPPDQLAEMLDETIGPLVPPLRGGHRGVPSSDLDTVFDDAEWLRYHSQIGATDIQKALERIIGEVGHREALRRAA